MEAVFKAFQSEFGKPDIQRNPADGSAVLKIFGEELFFSGEEVAKRISKDISFINLLCSR